MRILSVWIDEPFPPLVNCTAHTFEPFEPSLNGAQTWRCSTCGRLATDEESDEHEAAHEPDVANLPTVAALLEQNYMGELLDYVMPDLVESFRLGPQHPETARLQQRAADRVRLAFTDEIGWPSVEREAILFAIASIAHWTHTNTPALAEATRPSVDGMTTV
jgi:hypothetical protein